MVIETIMGPMAFGIRWRVSILREGTPSSVAASTNSCSLMLSTWERTMRAISTQYVSPIASIMD